VQLVGHLYIGEIIFVLMLIFMELGCVDSGNVIVFKSGQFNGLTYSPNSKYAYYKASTKTQIKHIKQYKHTKQNTEQKKQYCKEKLYKNTKV